MSTVVSRPKVDVKKAEVRIPTPVVSEVIEGAANLHTAMVDSDHDVEVRIGPKRLVLSQAMRDTMQALLQLLAERVHGDLIMLGREEEMSTQQAAAVLGVSRPHVVSLIEHGILPARKVGTHRRLKASDVLAFQHSRADYETRVAPIVDASIALGAYKLKYAPNRRARPGAVKQAPGRRTASRATANRG